MQLSRANIIGPTGRLFSVYKLQFGVFEFWVGDLNPLTVITACVGLPLKKDAT